MKYHAASSRLPKSISPLDPCSTNPHPIGRGEGEDLPVPR